MLQRHPCNFLPIVGGSQLEDREQKLFWPWVKNKKDSGFGHKLNSLLSPATINYLSPPGKAFYRAK